MQVSEIPAALRVPGLEGLIERLDDGRYREARMGNAEQGDAREALAGEHVGRAAAAVQLDRAAEVERPPVPGLVRRREQVAGQRVGAVVAGLLEPGQGALQALLGPELPLEQVLDDDVL